MAVGQGRRADRGTGHAGVGLVSGMVAGSEGDIWLRLPRPRAAYRQRVAPTTLRRPYAMKASFIPLDL
jgi:hypothetical protein